VPVYAHLDDAPVWPHELATLATTDHFDAGTATTQLLAGGHTRCPGPDEDLWDGHRDHPLSDGQLLHAGPLTARVLPPPAARPCPCPATCSPVTPCSRAAPDSPADPCPTSRRSSAR